MFKFSDDVRAAVNSTVANMLHFEELSKAAAAQDNAKLQSHYTLLKAAYEAAFMNMVFMQPEREDGLKWTTIYDYIEKNLNWDWRKFPLMSYDEIACKVINLAIQNLTMTNAPVKQRKTKCQIDGITISVCGCSVKVKRLSNDRLLVMLPDDNGIYDEMYGSTVYKNAVDPSAFDVTKDVINTWINNGDINEKDAVFAKQMVSNVLQTMQAPPMSND